MYLVVVDVKPLEDYKLLLTFENGEKRTFDMKPYLDKGVFIELKEKKLFKTVRVSFDSIEWINKADIDPEVLYENSVEYRCNQPKGRFVRFVFPFIYFKKLCQYRDRRLKIE